MCFFLRSIRTTATTRSRNGTYDNLNCNYHQELLSEKNDFIVKDLMSQSLDSNVKRQLNAVSQRDKVRFITISNNHNVRKFTPSQCFVAGVACNY